MTTIPSSAATPAGALHTAFEGHRLLARGPLADIALTVRQTSAAGSDAAILVFDDQTGKQVDLDLRGDDAQIRQRYQPQPIASAAPVEDAAEAADAAPRGRGRPKLGVVPREVTLLPRHWDWLGAQPGGASVALRKLVEQARRDNEARDQQRQRQEAAYHFMSSMAGNLAGFEEATRALYAGDRERFARQLADWPQDVRDYAMHLAWADAAA
ncbi:hypothetical protein LMG3458_02743 [Achromobacter deleyi]|uniref:DUF2239 domain-containing protein n=1 Tax=Achromobacter deleyi TaxID=1353891 RepID=A0A6S6ZY06_9BURK|nr:DUF2239 family protein [Achromobacter deleyi]CAB3702645.1 hypothetical protein LMG3458_02743 [Achromobacter deleyi]CAB3858325.1 hypothetical protein LMG3482_02137 [Achromobacter deleyi]CAB3872086.1 hypothetical protein LMG3412_02808 [Achromobacter deleyi]CAB3883911.1 hypothetical protein LMG3481_03403 [Achromobacter deleyi]